MFLYVERAEEMGENYEKQIQQIMAAMECRRDFACCKSDPKPFCEVIDVDLENHLEIKGRYDYFCKHLVISNGIRYCRCPLCVNLTRKIGQ